MNKENAIIINGVRYDAVVNETKKPCCDLCDYESHCQTQPCYTWECMDIDRYYYLKKSNTDEKD